MMNLISNYKIRYNGSSFSSAPPDNGYFFSFFFGLTGGMKIMNLIKVHDFHPHPWFWFYDGYKIDLASFFLFAATAVAAAASLFLQFSIKTFRGNIIPGNNILFFGKDTIFDVLGPFLTFLQQKHFFHTSLLLPLQDCHQSLYLKHRTLSTFFKTFFLYG